MRNKHEIQNSGFEGWSLVKSNLVIRNFLVIAQLFSIATQFAHYLSSELTYWTRKIVPYCQFVLYLLFSHSLVLHPSLTFQQPAISSEQLEIEHKKLIMVSRLQIGLLKKKLISVLLWQGHCLKMKWILWFIISSK